MKKFLLLMVAVLGMAISTKADNVCKVAGTDNCTVSASVDDWNEEEHTVTLSFNSDCDTAVVVEYRVRKGGSSILIAEGSVTVQPNSSTTKTVKCYQWCTGKIKVEVFGARCTK